MRVLVSALAVSLLIAGGAAAQTPSAAPAPAAAAPSPQWLIVLTPREDLRDPKAWTAADQQAVGAHFARLQQEAKAGRVVFGGRTLDEEPNGWLAADTLGLVVLEAPTREAAEAWAAEDAAVKAGVMKARVHSYRIAVARD